MANLTLPSLLLLLLLGATASDAALTYNVLRYGARADGKGDSTKAFSAAWLAACGSMHPSTVYVPPGTYQVGPIQFSGPMLTVQSLSFVWSNDVTVSGLRSRNSQMMHVAIDECTDVRIQNVNLRAPSSSPNTDGIGVHRSSGVTISHSTIMTGDDCISIGQGSRNIWMQHIACGPGHGISIGSLGDSANEEGVQNVTLTGAVFTVPIRSWSFFQAQLSLRL